MALVELPCGLCGGQRFRPVYASTLEDPEADPALYFSSGRQRAGHLQIVRCLDCGLLQSNPRDDPETLRRVYQRLADPVYTGEEENRRLTARRYLRLLQRWRHPPGRLLDVGCSTGVFLSEAARLGWQLAGLEPSSWAVATARNRLPQAQIVQGALEEAEFPPQSFEVICLWDVLEHLPEPLQALRLLYDWLRPGGLLLANLPDAASLPARLLGRRWMLLLREHLWYFTPQTYGTLLARAGYRLLESRSNRVRFSLHNIVQRLSQYPGVLSPAWRRLARWPALKKAAVSFPIGELTAIAEKLP